MILKLENISKSYKKFFVLENINMTFEEGIYGLLAPNGAGKTTLIKMLVTLAKPTTGAIYYDEQAILSLGAGYRTLIGYLPQQFGYYKNQSPKQYLRYLGALKGMDSKEIDARIAVVMKLVALEEVINKKMRKFSGGMIQRVGIAQALLSNPKILILDEPTAGLDPKERARFRHLLTELARERIIIISTHVVSDIEAISNEIILLKNKESYFKGTPEKILQTIEGKIFEKTMSFEQFETFRTNYLTLAEKQQNNQMLVRFYSERLQSIDWHSVAPQLEDAFLITYADEALGI